MSDRPQDPELRARFAELRRDDASRAPAFADVMARVTAELDTGVSVKQRRPSLTPRRLGWAGGLAAAAAIASLIAIPRVGSDQAAFERAVRSFQTNAALGAWRSPTAGLLELPGSHLISTIPAMGAESSRRSR